MEFIKLPEEKKNKRKMYIRLIREWVHINHDGAVITLAGLPFLFIGLIIDIVQVLMFHTSIVDNDCLLMITIGFILLPFIFITINVSSCLIYIFENIEQIG